MKLRESARTSMSQLLSAKQTAARKSAAHSQNQRLEKLLVVGGGMAAFGFCRKLVELGLQEQFSITVHGEEPRPAYDRVNISSIFSGRDIEELVLAPREWYQQHFIQLQTGSSICRIHPEQQLVESDGGEQFHYDRLVLATGSSPWLPPIPGIHSEGVFVYRTVEDLQSIRTYIEECGAKRSAVIGGGLLGLEAAKIMMDLGLSVSIVEMAPGLMPRQLDAGGAKVLKSRIEALGVQVHLTRRTRQIKRQGNVLRLGFQEPQELEVDVILVAAGIRPRDELGLEAGLALGQRGGYAVNRHLETSEPNIYAIGECAAFDDYTYGLVAPCYLMADVLARRLAGEEVAFSRADESAELKLLGIPVNALGKALGNAAGGVVIQNEDESGYRKLILEQGRVIGASSVGECEDLDALRLAVHQQKRLWPHQRSRFVKSGRLSPAGESIHVDQWPSDATVCVCHGVQRGQLTAAVESGADSVQALAERTLASTSCGSCRHLLQQAVGQSTENETGWGTWFVLIASMLSAVLAITISVFPGPMFAASVQANWRNFDFLWRENYARQLTGYSLLTTTVVGLIFSLRKRTKLLNFSGYGFWRSFHIAVGTLVLCLVGLHTGMSLGANLNFALSSTFLATAFLGALAGLASGLESRVKGEWAIAVRVWRPRLTQWHYWLFWLLPGLIAAHIFCVYWY